MRYLPRLIVMFLCGTFLAFFLSSCATLDAPDDAHYGMITVFVDPATLNNTTRPQKLTAFESNLRNQFKGTLQENWVRCQHCEKPGPLPEELGYIYILEHGDNLRKFDNALAKTNQELPTNKLLLSVAEAPPGPPDCASSSTCTPPGCTCIQASVCPSGCKKQGTATCCAKKP